MTALALADRWRAAAPRLSFAPGLEAGLALLVILLFSNALIGPLLTDPDDPDASSTLLRLMWPPVYALALALILLKPGPVWRQAVRAWPLVLFGLLPFVSVAWSISPDTAVRRGLGVIMTLVFALWLAARYDWRDLIRLLALAFAVLAAGSLVAAVAVPSFGVMQEIFPGAWRGLWWEKNLMGATMAFAALSFLAASLTTPHRREARIWLALAPLAVFLVVMSTSRTAMILTAAGLGGAGLIWVARRGFLSAALAITFGGFGVAALVGVIVLGPAQVLAMLGRDATLTGRTDIWGALIEAVRARPWTGYGFEAFWEAENGPVYWVEQATNFLPSHAHNAWLETALAFGLPGLALAALLYLSGLATGLRRLFRGPETYWALPFLTAWGIMSLSESNLMGANSFFWMLFSLTLAKLAGPRGR